MQIYKNNKHFGEIIEDTYVSHRKPENFFRKFQGFGISDWVLDMLKYKGIYKILIIYHGNRGITKFDFTLQQYLDSPDEWSYEGNSEKIVNINYDKQYDDNQMKGGLKIWKNKKLF